MTRFLVLLAVTATPVIVRAQVIQVEVRSEASGGPIVGALVTLMDPNRSILGRGLANHQGRFRFEVEPGAYLVRVDAIGFQGQPPLDVRLEQGQPQRLEVVLTAQPLQLDELVVASEGPVSCRADEREAGAVAQLWGESRKALLATQVTRSTAPPVLEVTTFEREMDRRGRVIDNREYTSRGAVKRPFVALDATVLHDEGYVREDSHGRRYYGPDAELLLSEEFLQDHCFRVGGERSEGGRRLVSLAFEPTRGRRSADVGGELWLDVESAELRYLEYTYRNIDLPVGAGRAGGRIDFSRLPSGGWIVSEWVIRMPRVIQVRLYRGSRDSLAGYREAGGGARPVASGVAVGATESALVGTVVDSTTGVPLAGVRVSMQAGAFADTTDSTGGFRINSGARGAYLVTIADPRFELLGVDTLRRGARLVRGQTTTLDVAVGLFAAAVRTTCPADTARPDRGLVVGQVVDSLGSPVAEIDVAVRFQKALAVTTRGVSEQAVLVETRTTASGYFHACGLPLDREAVVTAARPGGRPVKVSIVGPTRLRFIELRLP